MKLTISEIYLITVLAVNSWKDIREHEISLPLTIASFPVALIYAFLSRADLPYGLALSILPGFMSFAITILTRGAIGAGDGILLCLIGIFYSPEDVLSIVLISLFLSACYSGMLLMRHHRGSEAYALAPFMLTGVVIASILSN